MSHVMDPKMHKVSKALCFEHRNDHLAQPIADLWQH